MNAVVRNGYVDYDACYDPCPMCGAWKWTQDGPLVQRDAFRCDECNQESQCLDVMTDDAYEAAVIFGRPDVLRQQLGIMSAGRLVGQD